MRIGVRLRAWRVLLFALVFVSVFALESFARVKSKRPVLFKPSLFMSDPELESEPVSDTSTAAGAAVPFICNIEGVVAVGSQPGEGEGEYRRFGTFRVVNSDSVNFVLQLVFANGGELVHERGERVRQVGRGERGRGSVSSIAVKDWELRYKGHGEVPIVKKMRGLRRDESHVYEVHFLAEDMQVEYDMELWGVPPNERERRARRLVNGLHHDEVEIAIEPLR